MLVTFIKEDNNLKSTVLKHSRILVGSSNIGIMNSNPVYDSDVCIHFFLTSA
jgi:hypothetical protein